MKKTNSERAESADGIAVSSTKDVATCLNSATVVVIVLTLNQREQVCRCVRSLRALARPPEHILVWDNGSVDGTAEALRQEFPEIMVHRHHTNTGVASGRNAAARLAKDKFAPTHFLFLDNDVVVQPGFVEALLQPFIQGDSKLAQTSAKLLMMHDPTRLDGVGGCSIQYWLGQTSPIGHGEVDQGQYSQAMRCVPFGGATLFRADVFLELDGFDETFDPYGPEDLDFSLRAREAGYYGLYVPGAVLLHDKGKMLGGGQFTERYVTNKTRHWFVLMHRHAPLRQKVAFYLVGAPFTLLRMLWREGSKGNLGAIRGLIKGALSIFSRPSNSRQLCAYW